MSIAAIHATDSLAPQGLIKGRAIGRSVHLACAGLVFADLAAWQMQCISTGAMSTDMLAMGAFLGLFQLLRRTAPR